VNEWLELLISLGGLGRRDNLADLKRRSTESSRIAFDETVRATDLWITTSRIPDGAEVHVRGVLEPGISGIELRATVSSVWEGECRRCLELVTEPLEIDLMATFLPESSANGDADAYPFDGETVDIAVVVREELMLALPLTPLCRDDCEGADPERFSAAATSEMETPEPDEGTIDPRWAALSQLSFDED
jgi:uncharacterized protein